MKKIILDILEFSKAGKYTEEKELIDLNEVVEEIKGFYNNSYPNGLLTYEKLPVIRSYRSPVFQIFQNLIGNAFKYSKPNEIPFIRVKVIEITNDNITIAITDNGVGIEQEYLDKIFVIFQRLENNIHIKGTGIGLAIVKKIIERLGGTIWVKSVKNVGSTFYFTIPIK